MRNKLLPQQAKPVQKSRPIKAGFMGGFSVLCLQYYHFLSLPHVVIKREIREGAGDVGSF